MASVQEEFPALAGMNEVIAILGVSKQRAYELVKKPAFPAPVARLKAGPIWLAKTIEQYAASREKRPGFRAPPTHKDIL